MADSAEPSPHPDPVEVANAMWKAVYARDWDAIATFLTPDTIYFDVPTGPATAAKGPEAIIGRLKLGLEPLVRYEHVEGRVACTGDLVMIEHAEHWGWPTGESVLLPFVTVHRVVADKVLLWKDYWDYRTLIDNGPPDWEATLMAADLWWLYDATGEV